SGGLEWLFGGWPTLNDFFVHHFPLRVPHSCVFCKGGKRCCGQCWFRGLGLPLGCGQVRLSQHRSSSASVVPTLSKNRKGWGTPSCGDSHKYKRWATRPAPKERERRKRHPQVSTSIPGQDQRVCHPQGTLVDLLAVPSTPR